MNDATTYILVDTQTGAIVGRYKTLRSAGRAGDRKDLAYGSYRYQVRQA